MTKPNKNTHRFQDVARRFSVGLLAFSGTLLVALIASWYLLLPNLTKIEVAGSVRDVHELKRYHDFLTAQLVSATEARNDLIIPIKDPLYRSLRAKKQDQPEFTDLVQSLRDVATSVVGNQSDVIYFNAIKIVEVNSRYHIKAHGRVQNIGPRSMTIVAQFIEKLRTLPFIESVHSSKFVRERTDTGEFYSPFEIEIILL